MLVSRLWKSYLSVLHRRPWSTQMVQTGLLMATGDLLAQTLVPNKEKEQSVKNNFLNGFDKDRLATFTLLGFFFVGPTVRGWYLLMESFVKPLHLSHLYSALSKVALDQLMFAPFINMALLSLVGLSQGLDVDGVKSKLDKQFYDVITTNWKIWPLVQTVNFLLVPFLLRPLVVSVVALFWNTYVSWKANLSSSDKTGIRTDAY